MRGNRHRITLTWKDFHFLVAGSESMRGRELERVFFLFGVWTGGLERKTQGSFLALSLREKRVKWVRNSDLCVDPWKMRAREFLGSSNCLEKSKKNWDEDFFVAWPAKCWSWGLRSQHAWCFGSTCVGFQLVACGWNFHYNISCTMLN